jgi:hypothetical protein
MKISSFVPYAVRNRLPQVKESRSLGVFSYRLVVFEENAFVTKSRANAFTHSLKKRMAAAASVAKAGSGATVNSEYLKCLFLILFIIV